jgi:hypothetical protein
MLEVRMRILGFVGLLGIVLGAACTVPVEEPEEHPVAAPRQAAQLSREVRAAGVAEQRPEQLPVAVDPNASVAKEHLAAPSTEIAIQNEYE